ncbi:hypothetical protein Dxin01_03947 [Deinococcus xinjiangensis]|uniref:Uncharacterized protein n=1 Tax=Deinococcus xinjiangensis TaxID=457454 RepID=A0ABP9VG38_9DEIO
MNTAPALQVVRSRQGWRDCQSFLNRIRRSPTDVLLTGPAVLLLLLEDDDAMALHNYAGQGVRISVTQVTLDAYELDAGHLPSYIYVVPDVTSAVAEALSDELVSFYWR